MKLTIVIPVMLLIIALACSPPTAPAPTPEPEPDVEATLEAMQPRIEAAVREHLAKQVAIQEAYIADQHAKLQARSDEIGAQADALARATEAVPAPVREEPVQATNGGVDAFAGCLHHISREVESLPWSEQVGSLGQTLTNVTNRDEVTSFGINYCRHLAPVPTTPQEHLGQCVLDHVFYLFDNYPGNTAEQLGLPFALTVCIPPHGN